MSVENVSRLETRVSALDKKKIEKAVQYSNSKSVSAFVVQASVEKAEKVIQEHEEFLISRKDAEIFFEAIQNPQPVNDKLRDAFKEYKRRNINDFEIRASRHKKS